MAKTSAQPPKIVRDPKTGRQVAVRGVGSLKGASLKLKAGVDLTKPIAAQVTERK